MTLSPVPMEENSISRQCSSCDDNGFVQWVNPKIQHGQDGWCRIFPCRDCEKGQKITQDRIDRMFERGGMPDQYRNYSYSDFSQMSPQIKDGKELAIEAAGLLIRNFPAKFGTDEIFGALGMGYAGHINDCHSLALCGDYGTGKTALAAATANVLIALGVDVMFIKLIELIKQSQSGYSDGTSQKIITAAQDASFLILDECNIGTTSQDKQEIFEQIIYERNRREKPYMMTMNIDQNGFKQMWGMRIASRANQDCHWVVMGGAVLRPQSTMIGDV